MTQNWRECLAEMLFSNRPGCLHEANTCGPLLFQGAAQWSVVPQVAAAVRALGREDSIAGWPDFKRTAMAVHARSLMRASQGLAALKHLEQGCVPAIAFKGLASMASLYAVPGDRTIADADVLVTPENAPAALARLAEIHFHPAPGQEFDKVKKFLDNSPGLAGNKAIALYGPQHAEIDLHWSVGIANAPPQLMLERSESAVLLGSKIRVPTALDAMLLTSRHSMRENFTIDKMCRDLLDIRLWCERLTRDGSLHRVLAAIQASGRCTPVLAMTQILAAYDANSASTQASRALSAVASKQEQQAASELSRMFVAQVARGPISKDLLYLAHTKPLRQVFAGARANWREYRSVMQSMEQKLDGRTAPLAKRIQMLAAAAKGIDLRQFRSIRTLARLKYND